MFGNECSSMAEACLSTLVDAPVTSRRKESLKRNSTTNRQLQLPVAHFNLSVIFFLFLFHCRDCLL